jgi:hypothetical protein
LPFPKPPEALGRESALLGRPPRSSRMAGSARPWPLYGKTKRRAANRSLQSQANLVIGPQAVRLPRGSRGTSLNHYLHLGNQSFYVLSSSPLQSAHPQSENAPAAIADRRTQTVRRHTPTADPISRRATRPIGPREIVTTTVSPASRELHRDAALAYLRLSPHADGGAVDCAYGSGATIRCAGVGLRRHPG